VLSSAAWPLPVTCRLRFQFQAPAAFIMAVEEKGNARFGAKGRQRTLARRCRSATPSVQSAFRAGRLPCRLPR